MENRKKALITGASSGIGRNIAIDLNKRGYDIVIVARNVDKLEELKSELNGNIEIIPMDISIIENCKELYNRVGPVDVLVNNAGFGIFGEFVDTDLDKELQLINTNAVAVHVLTKLFLKDMIEKNSGYILNVASIAGYLPGPLMSSYYASKSYIVVLTNSIREELSKRNSNVKIATLNPGPVKTNFNNVAGVKFSLHSLSSEYVASYTLNKLFSGFTDITPGLSVKLLRFVAKVFPTNITAKFVYKRQRRKMG